MSYWDRVQSLCQSSYYLKLCSLSVNRALSAKYYGFCFSFSLKSCPRTFHVLIITVEFSNVIMIFHYNLWNGSCFWWRNIIAIMHIFRKYKVLSEHVQYNYPFKSKNNSSPAHVTSTIQLFGQNLNNRVFMSRNYRLMVAPRKFDVPKIDICPRRKASRANMLVLGTSIFQRTNSSET